MNTVQRLIFGVIVFVFLLACAGIGCTLNYAGKAFDCHNKWSDSGIEYRTDFFGGCKVSLDKGKTFIPSDRYRVIE